MRRVRLALLLAAGSVATTAAGLLLGVPWLLPVLGAGVPYFLFLHRVRAGRHRAAVGWVLLWALWQSLAVFLATLVFPERAAEVVIRGPSYTEEMLHWVRTGEGPEGSPRLYLPVHARHYAGFCVLSVLTAGAGALALGTLLLNYMNFYVAELVRASADPWTAALFGWPVWALIRVVGFVTTAAALTAFAVSGWRKLRHRARPLRFPAVVFLTGLGLVAADAVLKALLAPAWRQILLPALGSAS